VIEITCHNPAVPVHAALLRGINIGPHQRIAMADLLALVTDLGHTSVETYVQSGNVVFQSRSRSTAALAAGIERAIAETLGLTVAVVVRSGPELAAIVAGLPFGDRGADDRQLHVAFLSDEPDPGATAALDASALAPDELRIAGRDVYLHYPSGAGRSKLSNAFLERSLGVVSTSRNWRTVNALADLTAKA
jgi:uncharacterized protein (DUF1697 family)